MEEMDLDIVERAVKVKYKGEEYVLREASEAVHIAYRNMVTRAVKASTDGTTITMDGGAEAEPFLVSRCLFKVTEKGEEAVQLQTINKMPGRVIAQLFEKARDISGLGRETKEALQKRQEMITKQLADMDNGKTPEEEAKNWPNATEITSS